MDNYGGNLMKDMRKIFGTMCALILVVTASFAVTVNVDAAKSDGNSHMAVVKDGEGNVHMALARPVDGVSQIFYKNTMGQRTPIQVTYTNADSTDPYLVIEDDVYHLGWIENGHVFYGRSSNQGFTWWYFDATEHASAYIQYCDLDPEDVTVQETIDITRILEDIYIIDNCHYLYTPAIDENGKPIYTVINDPYLDQYDEYETWIIDDKTFIKPLCGIDGEPNPPPRAPDLVISDVMLKPCNPLVKSSILISPVIENIGDADVSGTIEIEFTEATVPIGLKTFSSLPARRAILIDKLWTPTVIDRHTITIRADPNGLINEGDETNNAVDFRADLDTDSGNNIHAVWERDSIDEVFYMMNVNADWIVNPWILSNSDGKALAPQIIIDNNDFANALWIETNPPYNRLIYGWSYNIGHTWFAMDVSNEYPTGTTFLPYSVEFNHIIDWNLIRAIINGEAEAHLEPLPNPDPDEYIPEPVDVTVNTPPHCYIDYPDNRDTLSATTIITGQAVEEDAQDQIETVRLCIVLSGTAPSTNKAGPGWKDATDTSTGHWLQWEYSWDTIGMNDGEYTIWASSYDGTIWSNNAADSSSKVIVTVDNGQPSPSEEAINLYLGQNEIQIDSDEIEGGIDHFYLSPDIPGPIIGPYYTEQERGSGFAHGEFKVIDKRSDLPDDDITTEGSEKIYKETVDMYLKIYWNPNYPDGPKPGYKYFVCEKHSSYGYNEAKLAKPGDYENTVDEQMIFDLKGGDSSPQYYTATFETKVWNWKAYQETELFNEYKYEMSAGSIEVIVVSYDES